MRLIGVGVDLLATDRFRALVTRRGIEPLARRILSPEEQNHLSTVDDQIKFLSNRFALKEAIFKATSPHKRLLWSQVTITRTTNGRPEAKIVADKSLIAFVSLSHDAGLVIAMAQVYQRE